MEPKPFQKPHANLVRCQPSDVLQRAARQGNGFFGAGWSTTKQVAEQVPIVRQALAEAGRDAAPFRIGKRVCRTTWRRSGSTGRAMRACEVCARWQRPGRS
jgi:alkanesulfonate monooxygenase SsuD/methylene tetrahydromethanopterin reductase-like flavin-dependent oxidoreductase (luciferase family)